jgi:hypothetical protein
VPAVQTLITKMAPEHGWGENWDEIERNAVAQFVPNRWFMGRGTAVGAGNEFAEHSKREGMKCSHRL